MKPKEIREKETSHLHHELAELQRHLYDLRSQSVTEKLENPSQLKKTRRDIARMKTILRERSGNIQHRATAKAQAPAAPAAETAPVAAETPATGQNA